MPKYQHRCPRCDEPWAGDGSLFGLCAKCNAELDSRVNGKGVTTDGQVLFWKSAPLPAPGIHIAGPREGPHQADQYCTRCRALLACARLPGEGPLPPFNAVPFTFYPEGAFVERGGKKWQSMNLTATEATCEAREEASV